MCHRAWLQTEPLTSIDHLALQMMSASSATSFPSAMTPTFHLARNGCRCPVDNMSSSRLRMQRTGRRSFLAAHFQIFTRGILHANKTYMVPTFTVAPAARKSATVYFQDTSRDVRTIVSKRIRNEMDSKSTGPITVGLDFVQARCFFSCVSRLDLRLT